MSLIIECPKCGKSVSQNTIDQEVCWICRSKLRKYEESDAPPKSTFLENEEKKKLIERAKATASKTSGNPFVGFLKFLFLIGIVVLAFVFGPGLFSKMSLGGKSASEYTEDLKKGAQDMYDSKVSDPLEKMLSDRGLRE